MRFIEKRKDSPPIFQSLIKKPFRNWSTEEKTQAKQARCYFIEYRSDV